MTRMPAPWSTAHDLFDAGYTRDLVVTVLRPIARSYFRVRLLGAERLPDHGPLILAANHSGNAFPYDGILLDATLWERDGCDPRRKIRTVYEPPLSFVWWMRPFGIDDFWRRGGGVDMTFENFDHLLARGERVLYFPEGVPGIGKGFSRRYQLQPFHTSFVLLAHRHAAPVFPLYILNAEWIHPFGYTLRPIDALMWRVFGVPFLPLPLGLLAIAVPWIWYLAFPARLIYLVGRPVDVDPLLRAEGLTDGTTPDHAMLQRVAERVRESMQPELDALVARFGRSPYDCRSLWRRLRRERASWWRILPPGWPASFIRHDRDRHRPPARGWWHA
ncbi:MAG TPA: 1-acyl-sn-glycerol-3-phosphate acyltransferase, partial [Gemmatimonadaceae bacterium]|nr:1-acyl-sn-glycerol-3-phosphate acyltransferase [Gemmatimonadaceae bacterium]